MRPSTAVALAVTLVLSSLAGAKEKKPLLPPGFLTARTVAVMVDPSAGVSATDPHANEVAQKDVETALLDWGRFTVTPDVDHADLVIVIRKGSGKIGTTTVSDPGQSNRGIVIGSQRGAQTNGSGGPASNQGSSPGSAGSSAPHPQVEIGDTDDTVAVYVGNGDASGGQPMSGTPGWRYTAKDGLRSHDVPAVDKFRKAIDDAEKAAAKAAPGGAGTVPTPPNAPANAPSAPGTP